MRSASVFFFGMKHEEQFATDGESIRDKDVAGSACGSLRKKRKEHGPQIVKFLVVSSRFLVIGLSRGVISSLFPVVVSVAGPLFESFSHVRL